MESSDARIIATYLSQRPSARAKPVTAAGLLVLTLASVTFWDNWWGLAPYLMATPAAVFEGREYWRLFTTMLIHADISHLLGNTLVFAILSYLLCGYFGLFVFPICSVLGGALVNLLALMTYPPRAGLLGASGLVYLMAGFWVAVYFFSDTRFTRASRFVRSLGFTLAIFAPTSFDPNVSYRTHAIGLVLGIILGSVYFAVRREAFKAAEVWETEL